MERLLCPSMMCADFGKISSEIQSLDEAGADIFHCDVMDGSFVPNMALGIEDICAIRKHTNRLMDVHLMIENPLKKIDWFIDVGADLIYIHPESERYTGKALLHIKNRNVLAGIAINPDTSVESVSELLYLCDYVLVMAVNPGFAGQKFIDSVKRKLLKLNKLKQEYGFKLILDGACSPNIIKECGHLGVDGFVLGTSALFNKQKPYNEIMKELRSL